MTPRNHLFCFHSVSDGIGFHWICWVWFGNGRIGYEKSPVVGSGFHEAWDFAWFMGNLSLVT